MTPTPSPGIQKPWAEAGRQGSLARKANKAMRGRQAQTVAQLLEIYTRRHTRTHTRTHTLAHTRTLSDRKYPGLLQMSLRICAGGNLIGCQAAGNRRRNALN